MTRIVTCDYCGEDAILVQGEEVYPTNPKAHGKHYWMCKPCDAWVSCHENSPSLKPVGRLADGKLREAKRAAHGAFDVLSMSGYQRQMRKIGDAASRSDCIKTGYHWLAERMGISPKFCHIGSFDIEQCMRAKHICETLGNELLQRY